MKNLTLASLAFLTLASPASACGPSGSMFLAMLGILLCMLVLVIGVQSRAYSAAKDFMNGITPDAGGPYWLGLGFFLDLGALTLWTMSGFESVFGIYLLVSGLPKLLMSLAGFTREFGAIRATRAHY